jgi:hypothetical protein
MFDISHCTLFRRTSDRSTWNMVTGQLEDAISLHSILTAMFPCGSITGAPKQSTSSNWNVKNHFIIW